MPSNTDKLLGRRLEGKFWKSERETPEQIKTIDDIIKFEIDNGRIDIIKQIISACNKRSTNIDLINGEACIWISLEKPKDQPDFFTPVDINYMGNVVLAIDNQESPVSVLIYNQPPQEENITLDILGLRMERNDTTLRKGGNELHVSTSWLNSCVAISLRTCYGFRSKLNGVYFEYNGINAKLYFKDHYANEKGPEIRIDNSEIEMIRQMLSSDIIYRIDLETFNEDTIIEEDIRQIA